MMLRVHPSFSTSSSAGVYTLDIANAVPVVDFSRSVAAKLGGARWDETMQAAGRRHYGLFTFFYRCAGVQLVLIILLSRDVGNKLVATACLCVTPALVATINLMSVDLLALLSRQEEAIFLLLCSVCNAILLMVIFQDARCCATVLLLVAMTTGVVSDASFRTTRHTAATALATGPTFIMIGTVTFFHLIDAGPFGYITLHIGRTTIGVAEMVLNVNLTIAVLMFRLLYKRRALLCNIHNKNIRCAVYRHKLALWSTPPPKAADVASDVPHLQPLRMVPLKQTKIDTRECLAPSWSISQSEIKWWWLWCYRFLGLTGFALSMGTCVLPSNRQSEAWALEQDAWSSSTVAVIRAIPFGGFSISVLYLLPFVPSFQRQLFTMLILNFNVVFLVCQVSLAAWCLADMFAYDYRSWGVATWVMWFIWVLLSDALTPCTKAWFHVPKRQLALVLFGICGCLVFSLSSLMFTSPMEMRDRIVFEWSISEERTLKLSTVPFFMNRMFPLSAWSIRLLWDLCRSADNELVVLRGDAEYYCPMERYPAPKAKKAVASPRMEVIHGARYRIMSTFTRSRFSVMQSARVPQAPVP